MRHDPLDTPAPDSAGVSRRAVLISGASAAALVAAGGAFALTRHHRDSVRIATLADKPLYSTTVAFESLSTRRLVDSPDEIVPGTRVAVDSLVRAELLAREQDWLASLAPWTRSSRNAELISSAYLDMYVLSEGLDAPVAGWSSLWRHVWPRDSAHIAVAFAQAGFVDGALRCLRFLARVPRNPRGWFEARYDPDGRGVPDSRPAQFDGLGWTAWALGEVDRRLDWAAVPLARSAFLTEFAPIITSVADTLNWTLTHYGTVPVSPDYWERRESRLTLGTVAPTLAGLQALAPLLDDLGDAARAASVRASARRVEEIVREEFTQYGYPRLSRGDQLDAAVAFLLPPYVRGFDDEFGVRAALARAWEALARPAGGIAPGEDWAADGVSWTPETAVFALVESAFADDVDGTSAEQEQAQQRAQTALNWLGEHRTPAGSFSEKVLADGSPAAVAPLAWTAACVALAAYELG